MTLLVMYFVYCGFMSINPQVEARMKGKTLEEVLAEKEEENAKEEEEERKMEEEEAELGEELEPLERPEWPSCGDLFVD